MRVVVTGQVVEIIHGTRWARLDCAEGTYAVAGVETPTKAKRGELRLEDVPRLLRSLGAEGY